MSASDGGLRTTPEGGLSNYLRAIRNYPMLDLEREQALARRCRDDGDVDAAHRLAESHLRLVAKIAMGYRGYGLPIADLIAEGNVGLLQAIQRFDPGRGFRLATYAMWWIRAAIQEYILHSWSLVKMGTTAAQKKLFFNLRRLKLRMRAMEVGDLPHDAVRSIARWLRVSETEVVHMNRRMASPDQSLNATVHGEGEEEWLDWLADDSPDQESRLSERQELARRQGLLTSALNGLGERERRIFMERRLREDPATLDALSRRFGISRERVRQIEVRTFEKLRRSVRNFAIEQRLAS